MSQKHETMESSESLTDEFEYELVEEKKKSTSSEKMMVLSASETHTPGYSIQME